MEHGGGEYKLIDTELPFASHGEFPDELQSVFAAHPIASAMVPQFPNIALTVVSGRPASVWVPTTRPSAYLRLSKYGRQIDAKREILHLVAVEDVELPLFLWYVLPREGSEREPELTVYEVTLCLFSRANRAPTSSRGARRDRPDNQRLFSGRPRKAVLSATP